MQPPDRLTLTFVRALAGGAEAVADAEGRFEVLSAGRPLRLAAEIVAGMISNGVVAGDRNACRASPATRQWLRRQLLEQDAFAAQHRLLAPASDGPVVNLAESPLGRLAAAAPGGGQPFLERHHVEAGERVRRLTERAQLQPRVTMSYSAAHVAGGKGMSRAADIGDLAAEARTKLAEIHRVLPRDCAGVVIDVCGLLKGLQLVEQERGWPRRSAKLVLRIGLDQLARHYGLSAEAVGIASRRPQRWMDDGARPLRFE